MIEQRINLYQDRFREKRVWISLNQVAAALALLVVTIALSSYFLQAQLERDLRRNLEIKADRDRLSNELAAANAEIAALLGDRQVDLDIEDTARQISARKKVLRFVNENRFGSGEGFSDYLVALSRLQVDDVWLDRIHFGQDYIRIRGSSISAEQVPGYFARFSEQPVFVGNRFDLFEVSRAEGSPWKVDFEIATRGIADE